MISLSGDVDIKPGSRPKASNICSVCHMNFNSIYTPSYPKVSPIKGLPHSS